MDSEWLHSQGKENPCSVLHFEGMSGNQLQSCDDSLVC